MKKLVHIITGLNQGGAEMMLFKLLKELSREADLDTSVISLTDCGVFGPEIARLGVAVHALGMGGLASVPAAVWKGVALCRGADVIQTWMYHGDFFGYLMKLVHGRARLIWGVRQSNLDPALNSSRTLLLARLNGLLSRTSRVDCIVTNSEMAVRTHAAIGYDARKFTVIPNGFDLDAFGCERRSAARVALGLPRDSFLLVTAGRWDPQKGYATLLEGFRGSSLHGEDAKLLMCGTGLDDANPELRASIARNGLEAQVLLLGHRSDVDRILGACNLYVSSSYGEGFSNAIGEAMASRLACVVTDVGDSRRVLGEAGWVVPPRDAKMLAEALSEAFRTSQDALDRLGDLARDRVGRLFAIDAISKRFQELYTP